MLKNLQILFSVLLLTVGVPAQAAVIFDGGAPDQVTSYFADAGYRYTTAADTFVLGTGASTVTDAHWWGACYPSPCGAGSFTLSFYADADGLPGELIAQRSVGNAGQAETGKTVQPPFNETEYSYSAVFDAVTLTPGTTYWFAISNVQDGDGIWGWVSTYQGGSHAQFCDVDNEIPCQFFDGWGEVEGSLAFNLTGVPESGSLALLGIGLAGLGVARRRKAH